MADDLDLYRSDFSWGKGIALATALVLLAGLLGYAWLTTSVPVSRQQALDAFRAERKKDVERERTRPALSKRKERVSKPRRKTTERRTRTEDSETKVAAATEQAPATAADRKRPSSRERAVDPARPPAEGVYSWDTEGYEEIGGARRSFPEESQRVISLTDGGWKQHHYFSEQREIWTRFELTDAGAAMAYQRNKVTFGPVTEESEVRFSPPMLVGPERPKVGFAWDGSWKGKTFGSYEGRVVDHGRMTIGGEEVEVWVFDMHIRLEGETKGTVDARVWLAPEYSITVREKFEQTVESSGGTYRARWSMTLRSLDPAT